MDSLSLKTNVTINPRIERKIGIYITCVQLLTTLMATSVVLYNMYIFNMTNPTLTIHMFVLIGFLLFMSINNQAHLLSLVIYKCIMISLEVKHIPDNYTNISLPIIYQNLHRIYTSVHKFNEVFSLYFAVVVFVYSVGCISFVCTLTLALYLDIIQPIASLIYSILILLFLCYLPHLIKREFRKLIETLENKYCSGNMATNERLLLMQIEALDMKLCLSAMNTFEINSKTFISCMAFILTYSVVLIQTTLQ